MTMRSLKLRLVASIMALDDRDQELPRHIAAEDQRIQLEVAGGIQELAPHGLRAVEIAGE